MKTAFYIKFYSIPKVKFIVLIILDTIYKKICFGWCIRS